jgi:hypothetical protein
MSDFSGGARACQVGRMPGHGRAQSARCSKLSSIAEEVIISMGAFGLWPTFAMRKFQR